MLDYSLTFNIGTLREVITSLQYISESFRSISSVRDALVLYPVTGTFFGLDSGSRFIYDKSGSTCSDVVRELDNLAGRQSGIGRSATTASYKALEFLSTNGGFVSGRKTSIIAIQDGFSNDDESLTLIRSAITSIRSSATADFIFLAAGVQAQTGTQQKVQAELLALAEGKTEQTFYVAGTEFTGRFIKLLVDNNILCPSDGMKLLRGQ